MAGNDVILIGKPKTIVSDGRVELRADIVCHGTASDCFYSLPEKYAAFADTESSNCFLLGMLYPAMRYGENIHVEGTSHGDLQPTRKQAILL